MSVDMRADQRRIVYTAVALDVALAIWLGLTVGLQTMARSSFPNTPNRAAFLAEHLLDSLLVLTLLIAAWSELKKWSFALWLNLIWPLVSAVCAPILFLAEAAGDSRPELVTDTARWSIFPFVCIFILYAVLYRLAFRKRESMRTQIATSEASQKVIFYSALFLLLYPVLTYLLFATGVIRIRHNDTFLVLGNFLCCPLSVVLLLFALRVVGHLKRGAVALSVLALISNGLLLILIGFAY